MQSFYVASTTETNTLCFVSWYQEENTLLVLIVYAAHGKISTFFRKKTSKKRQKNVIYPPPYTNQIRSFCPIYNRDKSCGSCFNAYARLSIYSAPSPSQLWMCSPHIGNIVPTGDHNRHPNSSWIFWPVWMDVLLLPLYCLYCFYRLSFSSYFKILSIYMGSPAPRW